MKNITMSLNRPYNRDQSAAMITPQEFTFKSEFNSEREALAFQIKLFQLVTAHMNEAAE